jgi:protein-S-isoprenylcysteine O-methyltransferase Ste14
MMHRLTASTFLAIICCTTMAFTPTLNRPVAKLQHWKAEVSEMRTLDTKLYETDSDGSESQQSNDISSKIDRWKDNILSGEFGGRGEQYFIAQVSIILCIFYGNVPLLGDLLEFLLGPCLTLIGTVIAVLGVKDLGQNLSPWPSAPENSSLVTNGIYSQFRHPIYTGLLTFCIGISVWSGSAMRVLLTVALWLLLEKKSTFEEESLVVKFGKEYELYKEQVPGKIVPTKLLSKMMNGLSSKSSE